MAWDDDDHAKARKLMEQGAEKAVNKFARLLGYEDSEEAIEKLRNGRGNDRTRDDRRDRDDAEAERKAAEKRKADETAAEAKKREADEKAAREAEAKKVREDADARLKAAEKRAALREELLEAGIKRDRLDRVLRLHDADLEALPEADRTKGVDITAFAKSLAVEAPGVFAEGRLPKEEPPPADKGGDKGGEPDKKEPPTTGPGTGTSGRKPGEGDAKPKDFSRSTAGEAKARLHELGIQV